MALTTKPFSQIVSDMASAIQGSAASLVDLTVGSILRATIEACAGVVLWIQGLILSLLATTRAASSTAADLDTWMADYGLTRLAAVPASGNVTFSRYTATNQAVIAIGAIVQTADGTQKYAVTVDTTNPAYSAGLGGYVMAPGTATVTVPVAATVAAAAGNAAPGAINTLGQAIPGVDTVTNALQFVNGTDPETDAAFRARFLVFVASLSRATPGAVGTAVAGVQPGVSYAIVENQLQSGATQEDYFYVVADDGSGSPPSSFFTAVANAIDAVRPICTTFNVYGPTLITANVAMTVTTVSGYAHASVTSAVQSAVTSYVNSLPL